MIHIGSIENVQPQQYDEVWVICRSVKELEPAFCKYDNMIHVPDLAPSMKLFKATRALIHEGAWNQKQFDEFYVPAFLEDLQKNTPVSSLLRNLVQRSRTQDILLACFCSDEAESMCHRSIIAGILMNMGASIECAESYSKYNLEFRSKPSSFFYIC